MKILYSILTVTLIVSIAITYYKIKNIKAALTSTTKCMLGLGMMTIIANGAYVYTKEYLLALFAFGVFSATIDWLLVYFCRFVMGYTSDELTSYQLKHRWVKHLTYSLAAVDSISLLLNFWLHHAFDVERVKIANDFYVFVAINKGIGYHLHLLFSYLIVIYIFYMLIRKSIESPRFYRKKYTTIIACFCVVIVVDGITVVSASALNVSIIFYGLIAIAIAYYEFFHLPKDLLMGVLMLIVKNVSFGIICFESNGKCIYHNSRFWEMLGIEESEEKIHYIHNAFYEEWLKKDEREITWKEEREVDGQTRYLEFIGQKLYDSDYYVGCYITITDRTEQIKGYEREISMVNAANKAKSEFLSKVSHEIRTPVNSIYGMNEMILRESNEEDTLKYADNIKRSTDILINLINDVLDLSKIEAGKMELIETDYHIKKVIENVVNMIRIKAEEKGLEFVLEIDEKLPAVMHGDEMRIQQILINLLTNAVKYTHEGIVTLHVDCEIIGDVANVFCRIKDTGIGIKKEDLPKMFQAFERVEKVKNKSIQGTGLGLNITNQLLQMMDSSLEVRSEYGIGSMFSFAILQRIIDATPIGEFKEKEVVEKHSYQATIEKPEAHVLVVDDNAMNRLVFTQLIKKTKIKVTEAASGKDCLSLIKKNHYDIIFLDHMMPELDGVETYALMRQQDENMCKDTPVIMLTANAVSGAKETYLAEGFSDFMSKPIIPERLEELLQKYLSQ